jgi:RNA polymerase sigma-32 factor
MAAENPLAPYMKEVGRYPTVDAEGQRALAVKYRETGDPEYARQMVLANLRLVVKVANQYRKAYSNLVDLIQEGNVGLLHAVQKYDPDRGVKLSSYAVWWIRAYILRFIMDNWRIVKLGTSVAQRKLFYNLNKERQKLEARGFEASAPRLARALKVKESEVVAMDGRLRHTDASLDAPANDEGDRTYLDLLQAAPDERPDELAERAEWRRRLNEKIAAFGRTLHGRERIVFQERLMSGSPKTLEQVGARFHVSRERARQVERVLMDRLRDYLAAELGDAVEIRAMAA